MEEKTTISPKNQDEAARRAKSAIFPSVIFLGGGDQDFPFILSMIDMIAA